MTVTNTVTETEHLTPLRSAVEHINWNTLYQQKMALEEVSDMLYAKRKEDDTFGKSRGLEDNGSSNDDGESCPGGYIISDEAQIYDFAQYTPYEQLLPAVLFGVHRIG